MWGSVSTTGGRWLLGESLYTDHERWLCPLGGVSTSVGDCRSRCGVSTSVGDGRT